VGLWGAPRGDGMLMRGEARVKEEPARGDGSARPMGAPLQRSNGQHESVRCPYLQSHASTIKQPPRRLCLLSSARCLVPSITTSKRCPEQCITA
jgi:hypothetical protein